MYNVVRKLCDISGISIYRLEKDLGFSHGSIDKWKMTMPSVDKAWSVAKYFGVSIEFLLEDGKEEQERFP